jgi:hypothetical protein
MVFNSGFKGLIRATGFRNTRFLHARNYNFATPTLHSSPADVTFGKENATSIRTNSH